MVVFMGVVGAGKSVQGQLLAEKLGGPWISTGNILRMRADERQQAILDSGRLFPDEEMYKLLEGEFAELDAAHKEFVLDGFPRTLPQAEWLDGKVGSGGVKLTAVVYLHLSLETVMERLLARGRSDDAEETIKVRFNEYEQKTAPLLEFMNDKGYPVCNIDGEGTPEEIHERVWKAVSEKISST